jgi:S1-C subfamily serine protease
MPVKLKLVDGRKDNEKKFLNVSFFEYWDKSSTKYNKYQYPQLERSSVEIFESSIEEAMRRYGYKFSEDANVILVVELRKFFCSITGSQNNTADIELDCSIQKNDEIVFKKYFTERAEKQFEAFRQYQDVELLLSRCLSTTVEKIASNKEILNAVKRSYGKPVIEETTKPPSQTESLPEIKTGTGFAISENGLIATACHVIQGAKTIKVYLSKDSFISAMIIHSDPINDLALLKIENPTPNFLQIAPMRSVKMGDKVFTIGFPMSSVLGQEAKYSDGVVSALSGLKDAPSFLQITVPVQPGNSGGALVNEKGEVVGIITSTVAILPFIKESGTLPQNINWAVKVDYLRPLIELPEMEPAELNREQIINHVKESTFFIEAE